MLRLSRLAAQGIGAISDPGTVAVPVLGSARVHVADLRQLRRFHLTGECCLLDEQHHLISVMRRIGVSAKAWLCASMPIAAEQKAV
jgi:hypothetical protein